MLTRPLRQYRAQSAMEYLMTYGWAILIIAVVLGALFSLGVFNGNSVLGNACVAESGYLCKNPSYSHSSGEIQVSLGQNTGSDWASANFIFVPQGTSTAAGGVPLTLSDANSIVVNGNTAYGAGGAISGGLVSGQQVTVYLPVNGISTGSAACSTACPNVGAAATGVIWAQYSLTAGGTPQLVQMATINIKAS